MTVAFTLFDFFERDIAKKLIDMNTDTFKAVLTNAAPSQTAGIALSDITQIANGNGYTTDGVACANPAYTQVSAGIWKFTTDLFSWTSSSAGMAQFRYGAIYAVTAGKLVGWWDHGSALDLAIGAKYQVTPNASGLFRITRSP
jgi:hypothetical protein